MSAAQLYGWLFWAWTAGEMLLQFATRTNRGEGAIKDRGSLRLLLVAIFGSITAAIWNARSYPLPMPGSRALYLDTALALMIAGILLRTAAIYMLGHHFSTNVAIHERHTLRTGGLYRWVRHPSYTGMLLIFLAIGIREQNGLSLAIMLVFPTAALLYRIRVEEQALSEAFGEEYIAYKHRTGCLLPGIG